MWEPSSSHQLYLNSSLKSILKWNEEVFSNCSFGGGHEAKLNCILWKKELPRTKFTDVKSLFISTHRTHPPPCFPATGCIWLRLWDGSHPAAGGGLFTHQRCRHYLPGPGRRLFWLCYFRLGHISSQLLLAHRYISISGLWSCRASTDWKTFQLPNLQINVIWISCFCPILILLIVHFISFTRFQCQPPGHCTPLR